MKKKFCGIPKKKKKVAGFSFSLKESITVISILI